MALGPGEFQADWSRAGLDALLNGPFRFVREFAGKLHDVTLKTPACQCLVATRYSAMSAVGAFGLFEFCL